MQYQENSNEKYERLSTEKFNKISSFLTKFIFGENFDSLRKAGLVDSYIEDPLIAELIPTVLAGESLLFFLFKNKKLVTRDLAAIVETLAAHPVRVFCTYELINDYSMIVIEYPKEFKDDYSKIIQGIYSKLSEKFKSGFPMTREVTDTKKRVLGKEYTIYHHIFNKTEWLKEFWLKRLDLVELSPELELWEKPDQNDLVFNIKNIT